MVEFVSFNIVFFFHYNYSQLLLHFNLKGVPLKLKYREGTEGTLLILMSKFLTKKFWRESQEVHYSESHKLVDEIW